MSVSGWFFSRGHCCPAWVLIACALALPAQAEQVTITAEFKPDSAYPHRNKFRNTTPPSGYCASYPQQCVDNEMFSLQVPIQFESRLPIPANHASERQGAMIKVPSQWRELTVLHEQTREPKIVKVRIAGIGSNMSTDDVISLVGGGDDYRVAHNQLWGNSWVYAPPPCLYSGVGWFTPTNYTFFWKTPENGVCSKQAKFDVPWMRFAHLDFAYELETPDPLGMSSGFYNGSLTYTIGPNGDFDFGDVMLPSDSALTLNFNLDVQHTLKVEIPPGGEKVELVPAGGWQNWLQAGRRPVRLFRDQTFNISASSRFKMQMFCGLSIGPYDCVIRDRDSRYSVELQVSVTLPNGLTDMAGQPVRRQRLRAGEGNALQFQPGFYVDRAPGTLHFEVPQHQMEYMLKPGAASTYSGSVTVIWDSEF
ncbi:hypothetical protein ACIOZM_14645 [Pseudomonas sp. NPDC087346]|uniref:hypothetical protein n=1 Tax=Pseudomonas sp. NPDC087346 TaxID=3364438 RepID=UPI00380C513D